MCHAKKLICLYCGKSNEENCKCKKPLRINKNMLQEKDYVRYIFPFLFLTYFDRRCIIIFLILLIVLEFVQFFFLKDWQMEKIRNLLSKQGWKNEKLNFPSDTPSFILQIFNQNTVKYIRKSIPKPIQEEIWKNTYGNKVEGICTVCERTKISCFHFQCGHIIAVAKGALKLNWAT